jgi:hypothetical protein
VKKFTAQVISVHTGSNKDSSKDEHPSIQAELNGIVGDAHQSYERKAWAGGDKQPEGTVRRNERQWSAVSVEELAEISAELDLTEDISAACVGANLCFSGISELSRLSSLNTTHPAATWVKKLRRCIRRRAANHYPTRPFPKRQS